MDFFSFYWRPIIFQYFKGYWFVDRPTRRLTFCTSFDTKKAAAPAAWHKLSGPCLQHVSPVGKETFISNNRWVTDQSNLGGEAEVTEGYSGTEVAFVATRPSSALILSQSVISRQTVLVILLLSGLERPDLKLAMLITLKLTEATWRN